MKRLTLPLIMTLLGCNITAFATSNDTAEKSPLAVRANLLRWATLTPDIGMEWHITSQWTLIADASYSSWSWNDMQRRYALWEVAPQLRHYFGAGHRFHAGLIFKAGSFNYKFSDTGRQGDILGVGITGGYNIPINKNLSLDLSLALGYVYASYDKYVIEDAVRVRDGRHKGHWIGPVNTGITLVWNP